MLLLLDIGNTDITIGCHYDNGIKAVLRIKSIADGRDTDEYSYILQGLVNNHQMPMPSGAAMCSVVPKISPLLITAVKQSFEIDTVNVDHTVKTGLKFRIRKISELGADRIANAVAANKLYKGNVIVADFGTATTFCAISEKGEYSGGAIMPGISLSVRALAEKTAKLPLVELKKPGSTLGKNTEENIRSGVIIGHAGAAERIINEIKMETGAEYTVLATGGFADIMKSYIKTIDYVNPHLTLEGLRLIYEMNA